MLFMADNGVTAEDWKVPGNLQADECLGTNWFIVTHTSETRGYALIY